MYVACRAPVVIARCAWLVAAVVLVVGGSSVGCQRKESPPVSLDIPLLTIAEVERVLGNSAVVVVDTRRTDAFIGWRLAGVARGGHIPGAVDFSAAWLDAKRADLEAKLEDLLAAKKIDRTKRLVLYDATGQDRQRVAAFLLQLGYENLQFFDVNDWASDDQRPLVAFANHHLLVPPEVAHAVLTGERPETFSKATRIKFVEVSWGDENESYSHGHIPSSFHIDSDAFDPPPTYLLAPPHGLTQFASQYGFAHDDTVLICSEDVLASFRLAVVLRYLGIRDARVVHGGLNAWKSAGFRVETTRHNPPPRNAAFAMSPTASDGWYVSTEDIKQRLRERDDFQLVDVRTWAEHIGETSGYSSHKRKGRIPRALFGHAGESDVSSMDYYRNVDGTMRNADEIRRLWATTGIDPANHHLVFMCGGGWRAAEAMTYAQVMGLENVSLYSDGWVGWVGWSSDESNPIATGSP
jgi:molybdopterin synthase sulfurtransferase